MHFLSPSLTSSIFPLSLSFILLGYSCSFFPFLPPRCIWLYSSLHLQGLFSHFPNSTIIRVSHNTPQLPHLLSFSSPLQFHLPNPLHLFRSSTSLNCTFSYVGLRLSFLQSHLCFSSLFSFPAIPSNLSLPPVPVLSISPPDSPSPCTSPLILSNHVSFSFSLPFLFSFSFPLPSCSSSFIPVLNFISRQSLLSCLP